VYRGELQCRGLGMAVDIFNSYGRPVRQEKANWYAPAPSLHAGGVLAGRAGQQIRQAYFGRFDNIWCHGDYAEITAHNGMVIYGRSDAVLNPGGVRIGTAEIYRQVESFPEVVESLAVGQRWQDDERVVLFVRLQQGQCWMTIWSTGCASRSSVVPARVMYRRASSPWPISHAPSAARLSNWR
jgi:acetoacetyl-CoA synthetase